MNSDEQFVREHWQHVHYADTALSVLAGPHYVIIGGYSYGPLKFAAYRHTAAEAWQAAREFTEMRLEEIRQTEEEIDVIREGITLAGENEEDNKRYGNPFRRILADEQAALADLRRGMKEEGR